MKETRGNENKRLIRVVESLMKMMHTKNDEINVCIYFVRNGQNMKSNNVNMINKMP